jgi:hypothetical protein
VIELKKQSLRFFIDQLNAAGMIRVGNSPQVFQGTCIDNLACLLFATIGFSSWNKPRDIGSSIYLLRFGT